MTQTLVRRRYVLPAIAAVVVLCLGGAGYLWGGSAVAHARGYHSVTLVVDGSGTADRIDWSTDDDSAGAEQQALPWRHTIRVPLGKSEVVIVSADGAGVRSCSVVVEWRRAPHMRSGAGESGGVVCGATVG